MGIGIMTRYIELIIETLQAVKMGGSGSQSDHESALDYLAGSTLRGAFISQYLKQRPGLELHGDDIERKRWLEGGIRFLNGYPTDGIKRSYPFPSCLYADKGQLKLVKEKGELVNPVNILDDDSSGKVRMTGGFLLEENNGCWRWLETELQGKLHINLRGERTALYRYESIGPGQTFAAAVALDEADEALLKFFRSFEGRKLHLGGSRSNGYGLCRITAVRELADNPEAMVEEPGWGENLYLYCLSDLIVRDDQGRLCSVVPENMLEKRLGVRVTLEEASVQTVAVTGFNHKWGARLPQLQGIRKGSVMKYKLSGKPDMDKMRQLQDAGIGERLADGYGRILLLPNFRVDRIVLAESGIQSEPLGSQETRSFNDSNAMLHHMYKRIMLQRIREQADYYLLKISRLTDDRKISASLLAKWMNLLGQAMNEAPEQGKKMLLDYIRQLHTRKKTDAYGNTREQERLNQRALDSLNDSRIDGEKWIDYIQQIIKDAEKSEALFRHLDMNWLDVPDVNHQAVFSDEEIYRLTLSILREYVRLRRLAKSGKGREERRA